MDAATIADQMNRSFCQAQPGLVAYYKFDQGIGGGDNTGITTLTDETGVNNGALSGFALTGTASNFVGGVVLGTQVSGALCPGGSYSFNGQDLTQPGVYTVTIPVSGSCDSTVVLTLTQTTVNTGVAQNQNLLISQASGAVYQWINCATNQPIAGATGQFYTAFNNGQYAVVVTQNGCTDTSACYNVTTIGIEERQLPTARVWPTVTADELNIELSAPMRRADLRVIDMTGRTVLRRSVPVLLKTTFDVTTLVPGAYFIEVGNADGSRALRFVRE
ncbi:MAG TPA: T9SS type A sorting domain-containing protein [Flavobacteriales bacterium]|nr:T9SS type A sorting domain-containing protein [Flavobacteriales bacterium]